MSAQRQRHCIGVLPTLLIRECPALEEGRFAEFNAVAQENIRRSAVETGRRLARKRWLTDLEFVVACVLETRFVQGRRRNRRDQPQVQRIDLNKVVAEAGATEGICRLGLNSRGRNPAQAVVRRSERIVLVDIPVKLGKVGVLIAAPRHFTRQAVDEAQRAVDLGLGQTFSQELRIVDRGQIARAAEYAEAWEVATLAVVVEEEERLVLYDRSTDVAANLVTHVLRLDADDLQRLTNREDRLNRTWVARAVFVVAIVPEAFTVKLVRATLGDGVNHRTRRASILRRVVRGVDLKLANGRLADRVGDACAPAFF